MDTPNRSSLPTLIDELRAQRAADYKRARLEARLWLVFAFACQLGLLALIVAYFLPWKL